MSAAAQPPPSRTSFRVTLAVSVVLGLGILFLVNYLASRHYRRFDWTSSGLYTLSEKTEKVLKDLKTPVTVTIFMTDQSPLYPETQELLRRYRAKSPMITVESLDPTRNRARAEALVKEFGIRGDTVVFKAGDKKKYVTSDQLAELDFARARMGGEPTVKAFKGEQEFTSSILSVTQTKVPKVLFTNGHGERKSDSRGREGFFAVAEQLRRDNCTVEEWQSLGAVAVPPGTDALVIAGPKTSFTEPEIAALRTYVTGGGRALFFLDAELVPGAGSMSDFGLRPLLADFGLRLDDDIVIDPKNALPMMGPETVFAGSFRPHAITRILEGSHVVFPLARSVGVLEKPPAGWTANVLVETSAEGWGEIDLKNLESVKKDDNDVKGPVPLASAAESAAGEGKTKSRVVAFGDADFASNGGLANAANLYLLSASVNWALERESLVAIPPKAADQVAVTLSRGDIGRMTLVSLLLLPLAAIGLGLAVWVKRRR